MSSSVPKIKSFLSRLSLIEVVTVLSVAAIVIPVVRIVERLVRPFFSALNNLPGPKSGYFSGSLKDIRSLDRGVWHENMVEKYGNVLVYREFFGVCTLCRFSALRK
jgi:hypothetical protein